MAKPEFTRSRVEVSSTVGAGSRKYSFTAPATAHIVDRPLAFEKDPAMGIRRDVWGLGAPWNDTLLWYARGVRELQGRALNEKTSWRYLAAMHGFDRALWTRLGYLRRSDRLPSRAERATYWQQCQHQTWYFLPWHRGYLLSFETIVTAAIVGLGGPADWALPYWNYSDTTNPLALDIPPA